MCLEKHLDYACLVTLSYGMQTKLTSLRKQQREFDNITKQTVRKLFIQDTEIDDVESFWYQSNIIHKSAGSIVDTSSPQ